MRLCESALDLGHCHTRKLQNLTGLMSHHGRGMKLCPLCDEQNIADPVLSHVLSMHKDRVGVDVTLEQLTEELRSGTTHHVYKFYGYY